MLVKSFRSLGVLQQVLQQDEVCCKVLQNEMAQTTVMYFVT